MADSYKFQEKPEGIEHILTEIEDNLAVKGDVDNRMDKVKDFKKQQPIDKDMKNGEVRATFDGTNRRLYLKIGGELVYLTFTKA